MSPKALSRRGVPDGVTHEIFLQEFLSFGKSTDGVSAPPLRVNYEVYWRVQTRKLDKERIRGGHPRASLVKSITPSSALPAGPTAREPLKSENVFLLIRRSQPAASVLMKSQSYLPASHLNHRFHLAADDRTSGLASECLLRQGSAAPVDCFRSLEDQEEENQ